MPQVALGSNPMIALCLEPLGSILTLSQSSMEARRRPYIDDGSLRRGAPLNLKAKLENSRLTSEVRLNF